MRKIIMLALAMLTVLPAVTFAVASVPKLPDTSPTNNYCVATLHGKLLFREHQLVVGDTDSAASGGYWAFDNYERYFWVYQYTSSGTHYCAVIQILTNPYSQPFTTFSGKSPQNGVPIAVGIKGTISAAKIVTFDGTYLGAPSFTELGLINYKCNLNGPVPGSDCPGLPGYPGYDITYWANKYFSSISNYNELQWGFVYNVKPGPYHCSSSVWYNMAPINGGNSGDIVCN